MFLRLPPPQALLWSVIGGYLLLPSATKFDLQGLPDLDKSSMIAIGAGVGTVLFGTRRKNIAGGWLFYGLGSVFVLAPFATAYFNRDPIVNERLFFPGMSLYDGVSFAGVNLFALVPYWAGRRLISNEAGHRALLRALVVAMLGYSLLVLLEIRLSPQLHRWTYGFFPHSFDQQMRAGGFRAVVFLQHSLLVGLLLGMSLVATIYFAKQRTKVFGVNAYVWCLCLIVVVLLQKALGAAVLAILFSAVVLWFQPRRQLLLAALLAMAVLAYPALRSTHLVPVETIRQVSAGFSADRAESFDVRLVNEELLLGRANLRPMFGWGGWGRNRVYDAESTRDISITDGLWIIVMGSAGWVGYLSMFGLLAVPAIRTRFIFRKIAKPPASTAAVALLLTFNLCDLLPNASISPLTWLLAGALSGAVVSRPARRPQYSNVTPTHREEAVKAPAVEGLNLGARP